MLRKWSARKTKSMSSSRAHASSGSSKYLDVPVALAQRLQAQLLRHLSSRHCVGQILLVAEHEQDGIAQLVLVQHALQLITRLADTLPDNQSK